MTNAIIGGALTTKEENEKSMEIDASDSGVTVRRIYNIAKSQIVAEINGLSWGAADSDFSDSKLTKATARRASPGALELVLEYSPEGLTTAEVIPAVGTVEKEVDSNAIEIPLEQNANWSGTIDAARVPGGALEGVTDFLSPQPVYRRREILSSFTFSEPNVIDNVATYFTAAQMNTEGLSGVVSGNNHWLKVSKTVRQVGSKYDQVEAWQHASNGWNTDIYSAAT